MGSRLAIVAAASFAALSCGISKKDHNLRSGDVSRTADETSDAAPAQSEGTPHTEATNTPPPASKPVDLPLILRGIQIVESGGATVDVDQAGRRVHLPDAKQGRLLLLSTFEDGLTAEFSCSGHLDRVFTKGNSIGVSTIGFTGSIEFKCGASSTLGGSGKPISFNVDVLPTTETIPFPEWPSLGGAASGNAYSVPYTLSPDKRAVIGISDGAVILHSATGGSKIVGEKFTALCLVTDEQIYGIREGSFVAIDIGGGSTRTFFPMTSCAASPDRKAVAYTTSASALTFKVWDVASTADVIELPIEAGEIVRFLDNQLTNFFLYQSSSARVRRVSRDTSQVSNFPPIVAWTMAMDVTRKIMVRTRNENKRWMIEKLATDTGKSEVLAITAHQDFPIFTPYTLALSPSGQYLALSYYYGEDGVTYDSIIYDLVEKRQIPLAGTTGSGVEALQIVTFIDDHLLQAEQ